MAKLLRSFRLSEQAVADLKFCVERGKLRMAQYGYMAPSEGETVAAALERYARYLRSLKLPVAAKVKAPAKQK